MTATLSLSLSIIFTLLSLIHFYWLFNGKWGLNKVIPTKENGLNNLSIPRFATLIVALVLISFGLIYLIKSQFIAFPLPSWVNIVYWFIPSIFILRAIGDFNYVGIFKKIKNTEFAKADSKCFIPLCLTIGIFGLLIQLMK